jgi:hypothetical protein
MRIKIKVTNEHLEKLYKDVFDQVYPHIVNQKNGVLYKVIHILLESEQSKSKADELCTCFGIKDDASLEDDRDYIDFLIPQPKLFLHPFNDNLLQNVINPDMVKVAWIVIIACILVGVAVCIQYRNRKSNARNLRGNARNLKPDSLPSLPPEPITAALCLVVPASVFIDLRDKHPNGFTDNSLETSDLKTLIDNASYFLCTDVNNASSKEQFLEMTNEDIPTNSNREVYIRIYINQGQEMIDKESPYILKRNLPNYGQRIIQKYACLRNLSGLENFNRI